MKTNLNLLFYLRKAKMKKTGEIPIYLRITVDGLRSETPTGRSIPAEKWDSALQLHKGKSEEAKTLNHFLDSIKLKISKDANVLNDSGIDITAELLKNRFNGIKEKPKTLLGVFEENNRLLKMEENQTYASSTVAQYGYTLQKIKDFLIHEYVKSDLPLQEMDSLFIRRFENYLRTEYKLDHNTVMKYLKQLKKVIHFAIELGYLKYDPFINHKTAYKEASRGFLTQEELERIENHNFKIDRLIRVKDVFLFVAYTGISYSDLKKLTKHDVQIGIDGKPWIILERSKTGIRSPIPLLPKAQEIINKYKNDPECNAENKPIPVKSNQKLNSYLSEIADLCDIKKHVTMHLGRHTFATTVTLSQGVPIETVSKMLGHTSLKTTQIYAKVVDRKIADDMSELESKLARPNKQLKQESV